MTKGFHLLLLLCSIAGSQATGPQVQPFSINTVLTCNIPSPAGSVPEQVPRIPLDPGEPGAVWLPVESGFTVPNDARLDQRLLIEFLLPDLDDDFSSLLEPSSQAPLARDRLVVEGSGGIIDMLFVTDAPPELPGEFNTPEERRIIESWVAANQFGDTPIRAEWTRLPGSYYPPYFAGSSCVPVSCSFPPGLVNHPDIGDGRLAYITVLRWDCCYDFAPFQGGRGIWEWRCGWRRVQIGIIVDCTCACEANFRPPGQF